MNESHPYAEYPRDAVAVPPGPQLHTKDGKLAIYVGAASGIGRLQHGFHALGFGGGHQAGAILISILLLLRLTGAVGLMMSRRWAFYAVPVPSLLYLALLGPGLMSTGSPLSLLWLLFSVYLSIYCAMRLIGRDGPPTSRGRLPRFSGEVAISFGTLFDIARRLEIGTYIDEFSTGSPL